MLLGQLEIKYQKRFDRKGYDLPKYTAAKIFGPLCGSKLPLTAILLVILSKFKGINQLLLPLNSLENRELNLLKFIYKFYHAICTSLIQAKQSFS